MLLGFISLLMTVFQGPIQKICIPEKLTHKLLPCKREPSASAKAAVAHYGDAVFSGALGGVRRILAGGGAGSDHCQRKMHMWRHWENSIQNEVETAANKITHVNQFEFIQKRFKDYGKFSTTIGWLHAFFKQFYGSVTKSDYTTMRLGFIMNHCPGNPKFNFYNYMIRALEADFKKVVGIRLRTSYHASAAAADVLALTFSMFDTNNQIYLALLSMSYENSQLLLILGGKLEYIITQLAHEVAEKHSAIEGDLVVTPSDDLFSFHRPKIVLFLIHFILFRNAFEIAYFFWILAIFDEHVQEGLVGWAQKVKKRRGKNVVAGEGVPMRSLGDHQEATSEKGTAKLIQEERVENSVI
ncbi:MLO-like protein 1 [Ananas comosus]|uniref:MLO-like protein 1 n=1 Tax=Ananas comosus TaxID=4615 RepID=A0A199UPQ0_ANACO|nr:MLO-like protein 1 [Ananas comosus]